ASRPLRRRRRGRRLRRISRLGRRRLRDRSHVARQRRDAHGLSARVDASARTDLIEFADLLYSWRRAARAKAGLAADLIEGGSPMENVEQRVKKIVAEQLGVNEADVKNESSFVNDLGADSLDTVELV